MESSPSKPTQRRTGKGYKLGPRPAKPITADALWLTSNQVCARYGGLSKMWLWRKINKDSAFPKPHYNGRRQLFSVAALNEYDHSMLLQKVGSKS